MCVCAANSVFVIFVVCCCLFLREFNLIAGRARPSVDQIMVGRSDGNFGIVGLIAQIRDIWLVLPLSQQADASG